MEIKNIEDNKKKKLIVPIIALFTVLVLVSFFIFKNRFVVSEADYTIPGVPYVGIFNHKGKLAKFTRDSHAAIYAIEEYWNSGKNSPKEINNYFKDIKDKQNSDIADYFNNAHKDEYSAKVEKLDISEIKKYLNSKVKTPLLVGYALDANQPSEIKYLPTRVIIGISESRKVLIVHDFWLGNNYEISFDDFNKSRGINDSGTKREYVVVQPKNIKEKISEIGKRNIVPYKPRAEVMVKCEKMLINYSIGRAAAINVINNRAYEYFQKVISDPNFRVYLPNVFKVRTYAYLANISRLRKQYDQAVVFANDAIELDHELDKPFMDWPSYDIITESSGLVAEECSPYWVLGHVYMETGNIEKAKENYDKALSINPYCLEAKKGLESVNAAMSVK
jgi:tetratricopeptide (TPR) repeat protein